jgi:hypothetical protein
MVMMNKLIKAYLITGLKIENSFKRMNSIQDKIKET